MKKKKNEFKWTETIKVEKTRDEQYLDIDDSLIELEKNEELVRLDMNTIEYPIFSKDTRRKLNEIKKYNFKSDGSSYLEVEAPFRYSVPGEFEERVFIALTKIMRDNNYGRSFYVTANEIIKNLNIENEKNSYYYRKLKEAIELLAKTVYTFQNTLYSNKAKGIIEDRIATTMMSIRIITKKDSLADSLEYFEDGRVKEVYQINFSDHFYENIITKGYLVFDSNKLLDMKNPVTRSMYTMIEKWRGYSLYIKKPAFYIARRIPLVWEKKNIVRTIGNIEKSFIELQEMGLIKDFNLIKNKKWESAEFEVFFSERHNKLKKESFFKEREEFNQMDTLCITHVEKNIKEKIDNMLINEVHDLEEEDFEIIETKKEEMDIQEKEKLNQRIENVKYIDEVYKLLPPRAKEISTLKKVIEEAILEYDLIYVLGTADYIRNKKYKSIKGYFKSAIEKNYAEEHIVKNKKRFTELADKIINGDKSEIKNIVSNKVELKKGKRTREEEERLNEYFESLDKEKQEYLLEKTKKKLFDKNPEYSSIPHNALAITIRNCTEKYDIIENSMKWYLENGNEEEQHLVNNILVDNVKVEDLEKEYSGFSMYLVEVIKALNKIKLEEENKKAILEALPLIKNFYGKLDEYTIELDYNEESRIGKIKIN